MEQFKNYFEDYAYAIVLNIIRDKKKELSMESCVVCNTCKQLYRPLYS